MRRELLLLIVLVMGPPSVWRAYRDAVNLAQTAAGMLRSAGHSSLPSHGRLPSR